MRQEMMPAESGIYFCLPVDGERFCLTVACPGLSEHQMRTAAFLVQE